MTKPQMNWLEICGRFHPRRSSGLAGLIKLMVFDAFTTHLRDHWHPRTQRGHRTIELHSRHDKITTEKNVSEPPLFNEGLGA